MELLALPWARRTKGTHTHTYTLYAINRPKTQDKRAAATKNQLITCIVFTFNLHCYYAFYL